MGYGWLGQFRQGSWRSLRSFVLKERRDIAKRIQVIDSELSRIGRIYVEYRRLEEEGTDRYRVTEQRVSFWVAKGSSLERLIQAYVANGGNPFDISHFFIPDETGIEVTEGGELIRLESYPYGGLAWPYTSTTQEPEDTFGPYQGGWLPILKYPPLRIGGQKEIGADEEPFVNYIDFLRRPFSQEIKEKIHNIESRILKLCDLAEQLRYERDVLLVQAFGGLLDVSIQFNANRFTEGLRVPKIVEVIDEIFYERDETGIFDLDKVNSQSLALYSNLWEDVLPEEANTAI